MAESAAATIVAFQLDATHFRYTVTVSDTGTTPIGTVWFSWVPGQGYLPSVPSFVAPAGWSVQLTDGTPPFNGYSVLWTANNSPSALQPGQSLGGFALTIAVAPGTVFAPSTIHSPTPVTTTTVYAGAPFSDTGFTFVATVTGSPGDDVLVGDTTTGTLSGSGGNDLIYGNTSQTTADNAAIVTLDGGTGNNALYGSSAFNIFIGGDANGGFNQIWGSPSKMAGVAGFANNTLTFAGLGAGKSVFVDLLNGHNAFINSGPNNNGSYVLEDSIANVPNVIGSNGGDIMQADNGTDRLQGGGGADRLLAGGGSDTFVYTGFADSNLVAGYDTIMNFKTGTDKIDVSALHTDASHLVVLTVAAHNAVYLENTPGTFNAATDLAVNVVTAGPGGLHASDFVF